LKKKVQVFVSSTHKDMLAERQAAVEAILRAGHIPAGMELFTAGSESQIKIIKRWIEDSDIFVLILGGRYGTLEPKTRKSYVELEYRHAKKIKKPYFAIVIKDKILQEKTKKYGDEFREQINISQYKRFRKYVLRRISHFYEDEKDIKLSILQNVSKIFENTNLSGWISGKEAQEIEKLLKENIELRKSNDAKQSSLNKLIQAIKTSDKQYDGYSYLQIKQFLNNEKVAIGNVKTSVFDLFVSFSNDFNIGVGNSYNNSKIETFLFYNAVPILLNYGLVEKLTAPLKARWSRAHTSKLGHKFIAECNIKIGHVLSDKNKFKKLIIKKVSENGRMKKSVIHTVKGKTDRLSVSDDARTRMERILSIMKLNIVNLYLPSETIKISKPGGNFHLYSTPKKNQYYAIAIHNYSFSLESDLADIRVMIENWKGERKQFRFIIATNDNLEAEKNSIEKVFRGMLNKATAKKFKLSIWDTAKLFKLEKKYHLR